MIQSSAAETLGHHCQPEGIKALRQAMRFPREAVALRALSSLVKCRPAHLANDLLELASNSNTNPILRRASLALFPSDLAASEIKHLVRLLREFRKNAAVDESAEAMAIAAIRPVSAVHDERAIEVLIETLALDPHESIRAAAARGLGKSCATKSREPLKRALKDDSSLVRKSSQQATLQCHFH
jgi:HEAT repeat protein